MPKPLLKTPQQTKTEPTLSLTTTPASKKEMSANDKLRLDKLLRKPRSKNYVESIKRLDVGGRVHNEQKTNEIIDALRQEFPEIEIQGILLGIVDKCYLGQPFEVHTLDVAGCIIEHFEQGRAMPFGLEKARSIAMCGSYEFIEVYVDCCRAISADGTVAVIT